MSRQAGAVPGPCKVEITHSTAAGAVQTTWLSAGWACLAPDTPGPNLKGGADWRPKFEEKADGSGPDVKRWADDLYCIDDYVHACMCGDAGVNETIDDETIARLLHFPPTPRRSWRASRRASERARRRARGRRRARRRARGRRRARRRRLVSRTQIGLVGRFKREVPRGPGACGPGISLWRGWDQFFERALV